MSVVDNNEPLEWHQIKDTWVGMIGQEIVCVIDKMDDMPCEAVAIQQFSGVFTSVDAAKLSVEENLTTGRTQAKLANRPQIDFVSIWRQVAKLLEPIYETANETGAAQERAPEAKQKGLGE
jgi:hypothetical protein